MRASQPRPSIYSDFVKIMNTEEISSLFTEALKEKLVGSKYSNRIINDVKVEISKEYWQEEFAGGEFDKIKIKVKISSPKGKSNKWIDYYL